MAEEKKSSLMESIFEFERKRVEAQNARLEATLLQIFPGGLEELSRIRLHVPVMVYTISGRPELGSFVGLDGFCQIHGNIGHGPITSRQQFDDMIARYSELPCRICAKGHGFAENAPENDLLFGW